MQRGVACFLIASPQPKIRSQTPAAAINFVDFRAKKSTQTANRLRVLFTLLKEAAKKKQRKINLRSVRLFQASRANVTFHFFAVFHVRNFLYVGFERSSGFTVRMAHVVSRSLTFSANVANLTHINTSAREFCKSYFVNTAARPPQKTAKNRSRRKTSINNISRNEKKGNKKRVQKHKKIKNISFAAKIPRKLSKFRPQTAPENRKSPKSISNCLQNTAK